MRSEPPPRSLTTLDATRIGIGAIVGGGIFVLAGTAFAATGPSAILAFALNGVLALLTAMSFAEMASAFPESGGAYVFAKRVLSVRAAFATGWVLWLAYLVAGVLYAMGFAAYGSELARSLWLEAGGTPPEWLGSRSSTLVLSLVPIVLYTVSLIRNSSGGGELTTWGKVIALVALVVAAAVALTVSGGERELQPLTPFLPSGGGGLLAAMGFTFIALQGFDLIAAVAGEVATPQRTIPRAMLWSLGLALAIYLPLLLLVSIGGTTSGETIQQLAQRQPDTFMAVAAGNLIGPAGYWLVLVAAVMATLSALHANILAASRVAFTMASDRTLPWIIGVSHPTRGTPAMALYLSALTMATLIFIVPDLAAAGAAASLIFLVSFALAHGTAFLARRRSVTSLERDSRLGTTEDFVKAYQTPFFPLVPVVGGTCCVALAAFQAVAEPQAGAIALIWLGLGVVLYLSLFAERAQAVDAANEARDLDLARLRGRSPLVLAPISNPQNALAMAQVASALSPPRLGKVLLLSVISNRAGSQKEQMAASQETLSTAFGACLDAEHRPEVMITIARDPWKEIQRVAVDRACESVLIGLTEVGKINEGLERLEHFMGRLRCDLSVLSAPPKWELSSAHRILVPVGGRGNHHQVRARLLASIGRTHDCHVHFLRVLGMDVTEEETQAARRSLERLAGEEVEGSHEVEVVRTADVAATIHERAAKSDLVLLGLQRVGRNRRVFGKLGLDVAQQTRAAVIMVGGR